jgi:heterodisulfide reductase subunit A-like polyferredoxin
MQYENKGRYVVRFKDIPSPRQEIIEIEVDERRNNYKEVELGFDLERAMKEAKRCLSCRRCLGCALCWAECKPEAIQFDMEDEIIELDAEEVIISPGVERALDRIDKRFGLAKDTNVITDLQLERMLNDYGPSAGLVIRPYDGEVPASIAFVQAYDKASESMHSRALTLAVNEATLLRRKLPKAQISLFAADIESLSEAKKALDTAQVEVQNEPVQSVTSDGGKVTVTAGSNGSAAAKNFDLVVLITQAKISNDARDLTKNLGLGIAYVDFLAAGGKGLIKTEKESVQLAEQG